MDVATAIGVDEMTIVNWEKRKTLPLRNQGKVERLCRFLELECLGARDDVTVWKHMEHRLSPVSAHISLLRTLAQRLTDIG